MALHESMLEEFGLAPRWVRRGMAVGHESAAAQEQAAARETGLAPERAVARGPAVAHEPAVAQHSSVTAQRAVAHEASVPPAQPSRAPEPQRAPPGTASGDPQPAQASPSAEPFAFDAPPDDGFAWFDDLPLHPPGESDAAVPAPPAVNTLDWDALSERVATCERCRLCEKRTKTVFGVGDRQADWMLIGEAPGENEDRVGEPFVGQAGKLLDNMLRSLTLARGANVYIANVIKCRPPGNRNPEPDEVARCEPYLQRQVALVKPKLIVALGRFAAQSLLKTDASISSLRGRVHEYEGVPVVVTYHPAYLLRSLPDKAKAWADLCLARDTWRGGGGAPSDAPKR
ncbi:uracil-DNA glycosylase [Paraburkholderia phenoliruptrix]|uniref:uracil-DNA glycosylase n=1 Tax=Paraburkholderia phenoliruptrix TaxID=252970 RepID=UPI001C6EB981|nr:uracil-DNA glycosylase [Paraburkholderia phenoliruptrix]MBW9103678.1 uracil-DNA glycosylase [Paraburkholderia phenoliruptrix]MBW9128235.1 uracil-DNA glycosylase [Paraburkholderia ginsengiterrae]